MKRHQDQTEHPTVSRRQSFRALAIGSGAAALAVAGLTSGSTSTAQAQTTSTSWGLTGNNATNPSTHFVGTTDNQPLVMKTNGAEALRIASNGAIGIGTTQPQYVMHVKKDWGMIGLDTRAVNQHAGIHLNENGAVKWHIWNDGSANGNKLTVGSGPIGSPTARLCIKQNGYVGVGTHDPKYALHLKSDWGMMGLDTTGTNAHAGIRLHENGAVKWHIWNDGSANGNKLTFAAGTDATVIGLCIKQNGYVGVGTHDPKYALHLKSDWGMMGLDTTAANAHAGIRLHENGAVKWHIWNDGSANGNKLTFAAGTDATVIGLSINQNGNVGIGKTTPGAKLDVAGAIWAQDVVLSSDARLKTNVHRLTGTLGKVQKIRGVSFAWRDVDQGAGRSNDDSQIGLIAQEVEAVFPELVTTHGIAGYKGVNYIGLIGVLVETSKELAEQNQLLTRRIELLEHSAPGAKRRGR